MYKLVVIGDSNSGKTNIVTRYARNEFDEISRPTIGVEFYQNDIIIQANTTQVEEVRLQIWDTAGQERFRSMAGNYYRKATGVLIVYDITNRTSFDNLKKWIDEVNDNSDNSIEIVIIGNKKDLDDDRQVSFEEAIEFAKIHNLKLFETSAKENEDNNIQSMFMEFAKSIHLKEKAREADYQAASRKKVERGYNTAVAVDSKEQTHTKSQSCC
jgi:small GTP-binding protein